MITKNVERVVAHTSPRINERIRHQLSLSIVHHADHPEEIEERLRALDQEWDIERVLETNSSVLSLAGLLLGISGRRRWFALPLLVQTFFLQHALQGWCPPIPLLRRLGYRTQYEIERERYALKALRGDLQADSGDDSPDARRLAALKFLDHD